LEGYKVEAVVVSALRTFTRLEEETATGLATLRVIALERKLWSQRLCQWIRFRMAVQRISTRQHPVVVSVEVMQMVTGGDITAGSSTVDGNTAFNATGGN
jgi:hypothetical protein